LEPLLFYVLQRASQEIEKPANTATFKVFVIDEAWIFLKNKTIRDWITRAEKTWRKKNAGYSVDLDQFHGLDQAGAMGLRDKVNNHYVEIFGASIALGVIAGAAEATNLNQGYNESGTEAYKSGVASSTSRRRSRFVRAIASRSTSPRTCFCPPTRTMTCRE